MAGLEIKIKKKPVDQVDFSFSSFSLRLTFSLVVKLYDFIFTHSVHKARLPKQRTALYSAPTIMILLHLHYTYLLVLHPFPSLVV